MRYAFGLLRVLSIIGAILAITGARLEATLGSQKLHKVAADMFKASAHISIGIMVSCATLTSKIWSVRDTLSKVSEKASTTSPTPALSKVVDKAVDCLGYPAYHCTLHVASHLVLHLGVFHENNLERYF